MTKMRIFHRKIQRFRTSLKPCLLRRLITQVLFPTSLTICILFRCSPLVLLDPVSFVLDIKSFVGKSNCVSEWNTNVLRGTLAKLLNGVVASERTCFRKYGLAMIAL